MARTTDNSDSDSSREPAAFDARTRRVMELRAQVRGGVYVPDALEVAGAMLDEWLATQDTGTSTGVTPSVDSEEVRLAVAARFVVARGNQQASETDERSILIA